MLLLPVNKDELHGYIDIRGRSDYIPGEFVFVAFQSQDNQEVLEFGPILEVKGDQYVVKLITKNNDIAVISSASLRIAGIS